MYVKNNFNLRSILQFTGGHILWITLWASIVAGAFAFFHWEWIEKLPWVPVSLIGTAVAFYIGFKNNQAYDRLWEARKIWGAIINESRTWGASVKSFVSNVHGNQNLSEGELHHIKQTLMYRHIAWLYALRSQLLIPTPWEHISQGGHMTRTTEKRMKRFGVGLLSDDYTEEYLKRFLVECDYEKLINFKNTATQIIDRQAQDLAKLHEQGLLDDFRHMNLQNLLKDFYTHQGKCERIKKFPLPRQYGSMSSIFVGLFIFLLPFSMGALFHDMGLVGHILMIPATVIVGWVYITMELVGDYSENPFEGLGNDIPMLSLCRVIEIDLREMLGETELPEPIKAVNGVLM